MTREEAIKVASEMHGWLQTDREREALETLIPELAESEDERMIREIKRYIKEQGDKPNGLPNGTVAVADMIAWLEKRGGRDIDCPQKHQDNSQPNGCIVLEDFNGGEGFYKLNLDYLNKKQVEEVEEMVRTWNKESKASNENIKACIGMCLTDANEQRFKDYNTSLKDCLAYLEKQKSAKWSEEDEETLACAISVFEDFAECKNVSVPPASAKRYLKRLKSLHPHLKQEWSKEDEANRTFILESLEDQIRFCKKDAKGAYYIKQIRTAQNWLKSLSLNLKKKNEDVAKLCSNE